MLDDEPAAGGPRRAPMQAPDALVLDFLAWLAASPRPYGEVMEHWRTSCPRLTVWEDAVDRGYVVRRRGPSGAAMVLLTMDGRQALAEAVPARD